MKKYGIMPIYRAISIEKNSIDSDGDIIGYAPWDLRYPNTIYKNPMCYRVKPGEVFPAGCPDELTINGVTIRVFRGKVNHYHTYYEEGHIPYTVEAGWDMNGYAIAYTNHMGKGRKALKELVKRYPPIDRAKQAFELKNFVRQGD